MGKPNLDSTNVWKMDLSSSHIKRNDHRQKIADLWPWHYYFRCIQQLLIFCNIIHTLCYLIFNHWVVLCIINTCQSVLVKMNYCLPKMIANGYLNKSMGSKLNMDKSSYNLQIASLHSAMVSIRSDGLPLRNAFD